jgi:signal transduction histidine kinase
MSDAADAGEKALQERIRYAKAELERMIDLNPQGMFLTGLDGRILRANAGLLKLLGRSDFSEVLGKSCEDLFPTPDGAPSPLAGFFARPELGPGGTFVEEAGTDIRYGEPTTLRFTVVGSGPDLSAPHGVGQAGTKRYVVLVDDVTEENKAALRREKQGRIEVAEALAGALNHVLNQPLAVILGRAQLLLFSLEKNGIKTEELRSALQEIVDLTRRVADTLRKSRNFRDFVTETYLDGVGILDLERSTGDAEKEDGKNPGTDKA